MHVKSKQLQSEPRSFRGMIEMQRAQTPEDSRSEWNWVTWPLGDYSPAGGYFCFSLLKRNSAVASAMMDAFFISFPVVKVRSRHGCARVTDKRRVDLKAEPLTQNTRLKENIKYLMQISPPDSAAMMLLLFGSNLR